MHQGRADWVFAAGAMSPGTSRRLITERLRHLPDDHVQTVTLLTSELVTNAVRHGTGQVGVHVTWDETGVRVEVEDGSPAWPVMRPREPGASSGLGLFVVDGLSSCWGVLPKASGKAVWFTLET